MELKQEVIYRKAKKSRLSNNYRSNQAGESKQVGM